MNSETSLQDLMTENTAKEIAQYIAEHFMLHASTESVDYEYDIHQGKMIDTGDYNTTYKFDVDAETLLGKIINNMKSQDDISQEYINQENKWRQAIIDNINQNHIHTFRETLRSRILKNIQPELVKLEKFEIREIDINPRPDVDFLIVVQRMRPSNENLSPPATESPSQTVSQELLDIHVSTGKSFEEIIAEKKNQKDSRYANVYGAYKRKYIYDIELSIFVDYSLTPQDEFVKLLKEKQSQ